MQSPWVAPIQRLLRFISPLFFLVLPLASLLVLSHPALTQPAAERPEAPSTAGVLVSPTGLSDQTGFAATSQKNSHQENLVVENEYVIMRRPLGRALGLTSEKNAEDPDFSPIEILRLDTANLPATSGPSPFAAAFVSNGNQKDLEPKVIAKAASQPDLCPMLKQRDPSIEACSPNYIRKLSKTPSDELFSYQWGFSPSSSAFSVNAEGAWEFATGSHSVVVATLDAGIDYTHPDLVDNLWANPGEIPNNGLDDDADGYVDDIHGIDVVKNSGDPFSLQEHGTHVAGIIGARGNNGTGVSGINWNVSVLAVRAADSRGYFTTANLAKGMNYLVTLKKRLHIPIVAVNASLGGFNFSEIEFQAIQKLRDAGILFVCAAGNEALNLDNTPIYPANYPLQNIISVVSTNRDGELSYFSNFGFVGADIAAPGEGILSTVPGGQYAVMDGTSMATPFVTGALALLASQRPDLDWKGLRAALFDSARSVPALDSITSTGRLLDVEHLVASGIGVSSLNNSPTSVPLLRDNSFKLAVLNASGRRISRVLPPRTFYLDLTLQPHANNSDSRHQIGTSTVYLTFKIDGLSCPRPAKLYGIESAHVRLSTRLPRNRLIWKMRAAVLNGEGVETSFQQVAVGKLLPSLAAQRRSMQIQRAINQACAAAVENLQVAN